MIDALAPVDKLAVGVFVGVPEMLALALAPKESEDVGEAAEIEDVLLGVAVIEMVALDEGVEPVDKEGVGVPESVPVGVCATLRAKARAGSVRAASVPA